MSGIDPPVDLISNKAQHADGDEFVAMDFAIVRQMDHHRLSPNTDDQNRPICPGLVVNHALWQPKEVERRACNTPHRRQQLVAAGVQVAQWRRQYDTASFCAVPTHDVAHWINVARDEDTGGLLETISITGSASVTQR